MRLEQSDKSMRSNDEGEVTTAHLKKSLPAKLNIFSRGNFSFRPHPTSNIHSTLTYVLWLKSSDAREGQSNATESKLMHFCMLRLSRIDD